VRIFLAVFLVILTCCNTSCSSNKNDTVSDHEAEESDLDFFFPDFPTSPFLQLKFGQSVDQISETLNQSGFIEQKETEGTWTSEDEKTKVILSPNVKLGNFKVFFLNKKDDFYQKLGEKLEKSAIRSKISSKKDEFLYFEIETSFNRFTVSAFKYNELIRLSFKLKTSH
jgi:hypothetical protein